LSTPRPEDLRRRGLRTMLGVAMPVLKSSWNNGFNTVGCGEAASLISALNSFLGEPVLNVTFLDGGVFPGVVGRVGTGVNCLEGVIGFLIGVDRFDAGFGVTDRLEPALLLTLLRFCEVAKLGLPVSDAVAVI